MVALGTGLGAGLGVPLLITTACMVYFWILSRRRPLSNAGITETKADTVVPGLSGELEGSKGVTHAELYGSS